MFSWKKQNPPSRQRQQQQTLEDTEDYSDIIARGLRLANEDVVEGGEGDEDMDDYGGEDLGDIDLDDPDLLAELQGLTGEAPTPKAKPAVQPSTPAQKVPAPQSSPLQGRPAAAPAPALQPSNQPTLNSNAAQTSLSGLGVDLEGVLDDGEDDEEVVLTEEDWKDPHLLAQLQSLGGHAMPPHDATVHENTPSIEDTATVSPPAAKPATPSQAVTGNEAIGEYKPKSASSSMIAIPPRDDISIDEDADGDTSMADHTAPSRPETKPAKRLEEMPKKNDKDLLPRLQTREDQYKRAALQAKRAGDMALAGERLKTYKSLQAWIRLVQAGGFLDLELYPIPDEPSASTVTAKSDADRVRAPVSATASAALAVSSSKPSTDAPSSYAPPISSPAPEATTQISSSIAEASADDLRSGSNVRGGGGIEFRQLDPDDDFQIVSGSGADTYDMLESQLESQIKMCTTTCDYYYRTGDKQTALEFHKRNKAFKKDLVSLQSYRSHGKKPPAFHFQDVRFELEMGFYQQIGMNDLSLSIIRAWDLSHKEVQPSDIEAYVVWDLGWPTENMPGAGSGKGTSSTVKKTPKPDFNYSKTLGIERSRAFQRFVERRKATFEVWHYRGMLWKDYLLGRAQVPLQALLHHSEINEIIPLVDPTTRRNTGGKIEIRIQLQRPLLKPEIVVKEEKWLVIDEFNSGGLGFPSPVSVAPASRSGGSPASGRAGTPVGRPTKATAVASTGRTAPSTAPAISSPAPASASGRTPTLATSKESPKQAAPAPAPAPAAPRQITPTLGSPAAKAKPASTAPSPAAEADQDESESDKALNELNNVEMLVSNTVLEHEIQEAQRLIHEAKAVGNGEAAEEHQDRLTQLEIKMKLLVLQVQTGQLTMEAYCQSVNDRILKDKKLAIELKKLGMVPEAKRALARSKIMAQEMKEVEEAMAAQEDEGSGFASSQAGCESSFHRSPRPFWHPTLALRMLASTLQQGPTASQQETQNQQGHNHRHRPSPRPGPGQDQGHATSSGSNKRKISSKAFTPPSDGQQHKQQQPSPSKYIEFEHAIEHSTRKARHQDDTKRTFTENGHQRHLKRPLNSQYGNSGSHGATRLVQDKEARLGNRDSSLQDFENISSSDRPSQEREQFSHQPPNNTGRHRGISPVSNAGTRQRPDATRDRLRPGYHGEQAKVFSARSPLPSNGPSESGTQSWSRLHQPPVTSVKKNEVLTIRDILDSQEIRDQISELRRSLNSNTDRRDPRASSRQNDYLNGSRIYEDLSSATSAPAAESRPSRTEQRWDEPARHGVAQTTSQGDGTATDLSMDKSLLEKKFRKRLDAVIPIMETPRTGLSGITIPVGQSSKKARTSTVAIPTEADANKREVGARKHRQDLYHSSYSPTEFSDVEDLDDNEDEDEDEDQDTVELIRHDTNDNHDGRSHPPPSQTQPTASQTHVREGLWASSSITHRYKPSSRPFQTKEGGDVDPGRDSGEISFEREVALARARRELGASLNHEGTQGESQAKPDSINPSVTHSNIPSSPVMSVSRLDRGRDLALEDLVSPTRFNFGSRHSSQQQQHQYDPTAPAGFSSAAPTTSGQDWRSAPTFPLLSTAGELAQLDIATGVEDRFLEMAGALGEGQAVASVLGTLKKMIRQLKTEKKVSEKATQKLQKELKKAQRDLERSRKANEKLSRTDHATQSSSHPKPGRADKGEEAESIIAQQEKDKIARNMVAFQKRIDALEMQKAELQMREQIRAKEEADLLLLVDSDDDSEQGEGSSESGSEIGSESVESDAANHAKYDKNPRQIRSVCSDSEHSVMQRPLGERGAGVSRRSPTKAPLASSSRAASRKFREEQESSGASRTRTKSRRTNAHSKSTQYQEPRQVVEKVEEVVHIHHHVYYGDDDQRDDPSPTRRSRSMDGSRRSAAANLRNLTHSEYAEPSDGQYHTRLGTGVEAEDLPRRQPPRQNPMPHRVAELPHIPLDRDTHTFWNQRTHHGPMAVPQQNQAFAQPFQRSQFIYDDLTRPETEQLPIPQRARAVTIVDGGEENPRYGAAASRAFTLSQGAAFHELGIPLSNSASAKQKKISINLRRILSLLKTHDPKRCTVCCNGGDSQDHERRHQEHVRKSLSMLRIDGKPVRIRQRRQDAESGSLSRTATQPHLPRRTIAALASPEDSGSSFSTESSSDSNDAQDLNNGESQELPYPRRQLSFTAATTTPQKSGLTRNAESSVASEQKLHIVLRELEEEVRHLRKSYSELHHDLEIIGQKSVGDADLDVKGKGRSLNGGSSSTTAAISTEASATETAAAAAEQRRQQKKLIREQLLKVVDSLGEKTDEIMRLQEQQEQRLHSSNKKTPPRSVQCLRTSTSGARNDTKRSDKDRREKNDRNDDTTTATSTRDIDNEHDAHEQEEQQANAEQDKEQGTDTSDSQGTARPRQRHPDHQGKASRVEEGKGRRSQSKEPEGYRHRLANGFRVPKLH